MKETRHVACMGEIKDALKFLTRKPEGKRTWKTWV
jgi:hypothetical protein